MGSKKVYTLKIYLEEKYGFKRNVQFHNVMNSDEKAKWKKIMGSRKILTPKAINHIHDVLGDPIED